MDDRPGDFFCNLACDKWKSLLSEIAKAHFGVPVKSLIILCILNFHTLPGKLAARLELRITSKDAASYVVCPRSWYLQDN